MMDAIKYINVSCRPITNINTINSNIINVGTSESKKLEKSITGSKKSTIDSVNNLKGAVNVFVTKNLKEWSEPSGKR